MNGPGQDGGIRGRVPSVPRQARRLLDPAGAKAFANQRPEKPTVAATQVEDVTRCHSAAAEELENAGAGALGEVGEAVVLDVGEILLVDRGCGAGLAARPQHATSRGQLAFCRSHAT